jgi:hypothetical protein
MILIRIREGDKFDKIPTQILAPRAKSASPVTALGHIAHRATPM